MPSRESIVVRFEGSAGDGILSIGTIVAKSAARCGFHACTLSSFLAEVRGGQSTFQLKLSRHEVGSPGDAPDVVVALNELAVKNQGGALEVENLLLCPANTSPSGVAAGVVALDFEAVSVDATGAGRNKNLVAAGALFSLLGLDVAVGTDVVRQNFEKKSEEVVTAATRAFEAGARHATEHFGAVQTVRLKPVATPPRTLISGNQAIALGAMAAGVRFFAGYPITPATEIMETLAKHLPALGGRALQVEDEIAGIGMCIGASFGGTKAMTATSGPGLSLMTELLGLASMAELPLIVVDVQRAGPSTGMPTKDGQSDLNLAVYGAHGDAPRVVLAPQSVGDCFHDTIRAANIATRFHIPVLILSGQSISHRMQTVALPRLDDIEIFEEPLFEGASNEATHFQRYAPTSDGRASVRSIPGTPGGMYRTGGLEHESNGQPGFDVELRVANVARRRERLRAVARALELDPARDEAVCGASRCAVVSWGSSAGATREACDSLRAQGHSVGYLFPRAIWPLASEPLKRLIASGIRRMFVCEANDSQQYAGLIRANLAAELAEHRVEVVGINRDDGSPFSAREIQQMLQHELCDDAAIREAV